MRAASVVPYTNLKAVSGPGVTVLGLAAVGSSLCLPRQSFIAVSGLKRSSLCVGVNFSRVYHQKRYAYFTMGKYEVFCLENPLLDIQAVG